MAAGQAVAPPPPGFVLDDAPPPPPGFELDAPASTGAAKRPTARSTESPAPDTHGLAANAAGAVFEPLAAIGTGMLAKPISDVAGLAATGKEMLSPTPGGGDPVGFKREVQRALTYEPRTAAGKAVTENNPIAWLSKLIGTGAHKVGELVAPPQTSGPLRSAIGSGIEEAIQQAPGLLGAKGGAKIAEGIPARQAALDVEKGANLPKDMLRDELQAAGYRTPSEFGLKARASEVAGRTKEQKIDSAWNNENATKRLGEEVGITDGNLIDEARENAKQAQYERYDALKQAVGPELQVPNELRETLSDTLRKVSATVDVHPELAAAKSVLQGFLKRVAPKDPALQPRPGKGDPAILGTIEKTATAQPGPPIMRTLEQAASETPGAHSYGESGPQPAPNMPVPTGTIPRLRTDFVMSQISTLRKKAKDDYAKRETERGDARMGIAYQLENLFTENLAEKNRNLIPEWMDARKKLAQLHLLDRITDDRTGKVDLPKLGALSNKPEYRGVLTGEFKLAADLARNYAKGAQRVTGEAPPRLTVLDGLFLAYGVGGAIMGHPGALAAPAIEMAGRVGIPALAGRGMLQNRTPSYQVGPMRRGLPYALPAAGAAVSGQIDQPPQ